MNNDFATVTLHGVQVLVYLPWWNVGILHGMTLADIDFSDSTLGAETTRLSQAFSFSRIVLPRQTHEDKAVVLASDKDWSAREATSALVRNDTADAVIAYALGVPVGESVAIGVRTADCVPVIIQGRDRNGSAVWATVHAGWRGLACSVISATCRTIISSGGTIDAAAVFACGGAQHYEVGDEVLAAIGATAVWQQGDPKPGLDLGATAARQLAEYLPASQVAVSGCCTISSRTAQEESAQPFRFHSYRRDQDRSGRAVTFVVLQ